MTTTTAATTTIHTTARAAILARIAHLDGMTQTTLVSADEDEGHDGGAVTATLHVGERGARIELAWLGNDGSMGDDMPTAVYDNLADHSDTDEIEDSIRVAFMRERGADVAVKLDWAETSATVEITIEAHARLGDRDNGGLRLVASTECDDVGHHDGDCSADVPLRAYVDAVAAEDGQIVTGYSVYRSDYEDDVDYDVAVADMNWANARALGAARRLLASLGLA
jgi:hypothetical protein